MESLDDILLESDDRMDKAVQFLQQELSGLRSGKASPSLVENINVEYYGTQTRLRQLANIATPEPRLIVISAYDPSSLQAIERAILAANVGVTPMNDGRVIRVPIPELNEERRKEIAKVAKTQAEAQKVAMRNVRRDANEVLKKKKNDKAISEDDQRKGQEDIQKLTDSYIAKTDEAFSKKEKEIMEI